jgi:hypothetical protein
MSDRDELIAKARELHSCDERALGAAAEMRTLLPALADLAESEGRRADEAERELRSIKSEHAHCDQVLRQRDRWEDQVGDMAAQAGCDNEFTSDHDHSHCVTEAVSLLRSQCDAALAELAKLKGQQP